jgi:K+-transporting ATPase ATPase A chain
MMWDQFVFVLAAIAFSIPTARYLTRVFAGQHTFLDPVMRPLERWIYRLAGVQVDQGMTAAAYFGAFLVFGLIGTLFLCALLLLQGLLPGPPNASVLTTPMTPDLAVNTAISFATTTTWQAYGGETTMRYWAQMLGLVSQNFLAGAAGLAVGVAFIRGFVRENSDDLGNFWVDLVRALLWFLLPLSLLGGLVLIWQGVPMNFNPYTEVTTLEGARQVIAQGPVAALEFIKNLGTNGGGFFNVNSAHPFENPTSLTNLVELLSITVPPAALPLMFGEMTGRIGAGRTLLGVMAALFLGGLILIDRSESVTPPSLSAAHIEGANLEGKEVRFGISGSALASAVTSNGATGSTNAMHDSYAPLGVTVILGNMLLGEVAFGGLGTGLYSMVMVALIAVFVGGLMIGRTPSYLGKKIGPDETKLIALYALVTPATVLLLTALASATGAGRAGLTANGGPHGFAEMLFAFASSVANNGQTMASLNANSVFYNTATAVAMLVGRFALAGFAILLAGRFAKQRRLAAGPGMLPDQGITFGVLVLGVLLLVGALSYLPALAFGPIAELLHVN